MPPETIEKALVSGVFKEGQWELAKLMQCIIGGSGVLRYQVSQRLTLATLNF